MNFWTDFLAHKWHYLRKGIGLLICILLFTLLATDIKGSYRMEWFDVFAYSKIRMLQSNFFTGFFKLMTNMVHPLVMLVVSLAMVHFMRQRKYMVLLFGNLFLTVLLNVAVKEQFMRARPDEALRLVNESGYSFPSGHSMLAASFYGFLIFLLWQVGYSLKKKVIGTSVFLVLILLVGCSRIYLGVHYGTDVLGGFLASTIYLVLYTSVAKHYIQAGENRRKKLPEAVKNPRLFRSFHYAFAGIIAGIQNERNMLLHYSAVILVVVFGLTLKLTTIEWGICLILCGLVISMELMNTAVEAVVDLVTDEFDPKAKLAKDTAAGAVLVVAIIASIVGCIIFLPKVLPLFLGIGF